MTTSAAQNATTHRNGFPEHFDSVLASQMRFASRPSPAPVAMTLDDASPVDMDRLLGMVHDEPEELRYVVNMYLSESRQVMDRLWAAVDAADWAQTEALAHRLAGTSATCGMTAMVRPLRELEIVAKAGRCAKNQTLCLEATHQHARVTAYLESHVLGMPALARAVEGGLQ